MKMYGTLFVDGSTFEVAYYPDAPIAAFYRAIVNGRNVDAPSVHELRDRIHDALQPERHEIAEPDAGSIIAFTKQFPGAPRAYDYVALRAQNGLWYRTGGSSIRTAPMGWRELLDFIGDGGLRVATAWATIR